MRISDWSSDVCSSDLRPSRRCAEPRQQLPEAAQSVDHGSVPARRRHPVCFRIDEGRDSPPLVWSIQPSWAVGDSPAPSDITPRSEEHTSELQSLMRISYAVFCLKKTKQNI